MFQEVQTQADTQVPELPNVESLQEHPKRHQEPPRAPQEGPKSRQEQPWRAPGGCPGTFSTMVLSAGPLKNLGLAAFFEGEPRPNADFSGPTYRKAWQGRLILACSLAVLALGLGRALPRAPGPRTLLLCRYILDS